MNTQNDCVRMVDKIRRAKRLNPSPWWGTGKRAEESSARHLEWLKRAVGESAVFVIDNVAEYLFRDSGRNEWNDKVDFPCIAPPFPVFWMEYRAPDRNSVLDVLREDGSIGSTVIPDCTGVLFSVTSPSNVDLNWLIHGYQGEEQRISEELRQLEPLFGDGLARKVEGAGGFRKILDMDPSSFIEKCGLTGGEVHLLQKILRLKYLSGSRKMTDEEAMGKMSGQPQWVVNAVSYYDFPDSGGIYGPMVGWQYCVEKDGSIQVDAIGCQHSNYIVRAHGQSALQGFKEKEEQIDELDSLILPCLMALTFLNCKNVHTTEKEPPLETSIRHRKRHGVPLVKYKTLQISTMTGIIQAAKASRSASAGDGDSSPLHICRGHFKDYRERGLFGRHKGIYWWDNQMRGSITRGVVFKDYEVN